MSIFAFWGKNCTSRSCNPTQTPLDQKDREINGVKICNPAFPRILGYGNSSYMLQILQAKPCIALRWGLPIFSIEFFSIFRFYCLPKSYFRYFDALPRQTSLQKIKKDVSKSLQVVSSALLYPEMCINRTIPHCSDNRSILFIRHMLMSFCISKSFTKTKIDKMDNVRLVLETN